MDAATHAETHRIQHYRVISEAHLRNVIKQDDIPWQAWFAGPSTWQAFGKGSLPVYVLELDTTQVSASKLVNHKGVIHDIETALGGQINVHWKNHIGLGLVFDERRLVFPEKIPLPNAPENNYLIPFGSDIKRKQVWRSIRHTKNIIISGTTQYGKTTGLQGWLNALIAQHTPSELKLALVDGKDFEFAPFYENSPYLPDFMDGRVATEAVDVARVTAKLVQETKRRRQLFKQHRVGGTDALAQNAGIKLPVIILVIDELKDLIDEGLDTTDLFRIAQQGVGLDIFIILGTQRADAPTIRKSNFATTVVYHLANTNEAQAVFTRHAPYYMLEKAQPGECVVLGPSMNYLHLKSFWTPKQGQPARAEKKAPVQHSLSIADAYLVKIALIKNRGICSVGQIYRLIQSELPEKYWMKGGPYTHYKIRTTFKRWEEKGLLTENAQSADGRHQGRMVTPELKQLSVARLKKTKTGV